MGFAGDEKGDALFALGFGEAEFDFHAEVGAQGAEAIA